MKLAIVIVSNKDVSNVLAATIAEGYFSTRISTAGQFLENGHTTILYGVEDEKLDNLFEIIENSITKRVVKRTQVESTVAGLLLNKPVDVEEYGAVAFVINIDEYRKL